MKKILIFVFILVSSLNVFAEDVKFEKLRRDYIEKSRAIELEMTKQLTLLKIELEKLNQVLIGDNKELSVNILKLVEIIKQIIKENGGK